MPRLINNQFYVAICQIPDQNISNQKMTNSNLSMKMISFFNLRNLNYFEEKRGGPLVLTFSQI